MSLKDVQNNLSRASVVLVRPLIPANIGAAARAVRNMGLGKLVVVRPRRWNLESMCSLAVRTGRNIILEEMVLATNLAEAVAEYNLVIGTTARTGKQRKPSGPPASIMGSVAPQLAANSVALVFGPEDKGLSNEELTLCHQLVHIPVDGSASSINLAQAVMILAYELRLASLEAGLDPAPPPNLALAGEIRAMYEHLEQTLTKLDSVEHHNLTVWLEAFRRIFGRTRLQPHEVRLIRGFCRKITWAAENQSAPKEPGQ